MLWYHSKVIAILGFLIFTSQLWAQVPNQLQINTATALSELAKPVKKKFPLINPIIRLNDGEWQNAKISIRGQSCLSAKRKCFELKVDNPLSFQAHSGTQILESKHLKLLSLSEDQGYIHSRLGALLMQKLDLFPLKEQFLELVYNGQTLGLYLAVEDPIDYLLKQHQALFIAKRRHFFQGFETKYFKTSEEFPDEASYLNKIKVLYKSIGDFKGMALLDMLKSKLDLSAYVNFISLNSLLQNGDYSDEVYFYLEPGQKDFKIMAWDFDDLFKKPHLLSRILHPIGIRRGPLYSLEDKLDRRIIKDKILKQLVLSHMQHITGTILNPHNLQAVKQQILGEIRPYLASSEVLSASINDSGRKSAYTSREILELLDKRIDTLEKLSLAK